MILVVSNRSHFLPQLLDVLSKKRVSYDLYLSEQELPAEEFDRYSGVVLSGGTLLIRHPELLAADPRYLAEARLDVEAIMDANVPVLGICLGHLLLCELYGSRLSRLPEMVNGMSTVNVIARDHLFEGLPKTIQVREAHRDGVETLPDHFRCLASSETTPYEAVRHADRPLFGVQFHPEASGGVGERILENFLRLCGETIKAH